MAARTLENWIDTLQVRGRYTFRRSDALAESGLSAEAVKKALVRLAGRGRIARLKEYFFAIVPLEHRSAGAPPPTWLIDELMRAMELPYYVALLSAAALHGASHHQPQVFQVMTDRSVRTIPVGRSRIHFFVSKYLDCTPSQSMKTPTGSMHVSRPEATVLDMVRFAKAAGHLDHVATVVAELLPTIDADRLLMAAKARADLPTAQRLGYLLDQLRARRLAAPLREWLAQQDARPVPLRTGRPGRDAREDRRWHVLVSRPLEVEA